MDTHKNGMDSNVPLKWTKEIIYIRSGGDGWFCTYWEVSQSLTNAENSAATRFCESLNPLPRTVSSLTYHSRMIDEMSDQLHLMNVQLNGTETEACKYIITRKSRRYNTFQIPYTYSYGLFVSPWFAGTLSAMRSISSSLCTAGSYSITQLSSGMIVQQR